MKFKIFGLLLEGLEVKGLALLKDRLDKVEERGGEGRRRRISFSTRAKRDLEK